MVGSKPQVATECTQLPTTTKNVKRIERHTDHTDKQIRNRKWTDEVIRWLTNGAFNVESDQYLGVCMCEEAKQKMNDN